MNIRELFEQDYTNGMPIDEAVAVLEKGRDGNYKLMQVQQAWQWFERGALILNDQNRVLKEVMRHAYHIFKSHEYKAPEQLNEALRLMAGSLEG